MYFDISKQKSVKLISVIYRQHMSQMPRSQDDLVMLILWYGLGGSCKEVVLCTRKRMFVVVYRTRNDRKKEQRFLFRYIEIQKWEVRVCCDISHYVESVV